MFNKCPICQKELKSHEIRPNINLRQLLKGKSNLMDDVYNEILREPIYPIYPDEVHDDHDEPTTNSKIGFE